MNVSSKDSSNVASSMEDLAGGSSRSQHNVLRLVDPRSLNRIRRVQFNLARRADQADGHLGDCQCYDCRVVEVWNSVFHPKPHG